MALLHIDPAFASRYVNDGFSGGEKKRLEMLQMAILAPRMAILDETDSGLDIDALRNVAEGINATLSPEMGVLMITHYQRMLNYVKPQFVHVLLDGRIVMSGGEELSKQLEANGYDWVRDQVGLPARRRRRGVPSRPGAAWQSTSKLAPMAVEPAARPDPRGLLRHRPARRFPRLRAAHRHRPAARLPGRGRQRAEARGRHRRDGRYLRPSLRQRPSRHLRAVGGRRPAASRLPVARWPASWVRRRSARSSSSATRPRPSTWWRTAGAAPTWARATASSPPSWSTTPTSCRGSSWPPRPARRWTTWPSPMTGSWTWTTCAPSWPPVRSSSPARR